MLCSYSCVCQREREKSKKSKKASFNTNDKLDAHRTLPEGDSTRLTCKPRGFPKPRTQWFHSGKEIQFAENRTSRFVIKPLRRQGSVLFISNLSSSDNGIYGCYASNDYGDDWLNFTINLLPTPTKPTRKNESERLKFKNQLSTFSEITEFAGKKLDLDCEFIADPEPMIFWYMKNKQLLNISDFSRKKTCKTQLLDITGKEKPCKGTRNGHLIIENVTPWESGNYTCKLKNKHKTIYHTFIVRIQSVSLAIVHGPKNLTVLEGSNAKFQCFFIQETSPVFKVKWYHYLNDANNTIKPLTRDRPDIGIDDSGNGGRVSTLTIYNVSSLNSAGKYSCKGQTEKDSENATAWLTVIHPYSVNASGSLSPTFQKTDNTKLLVITIVIGTFLVLFTVVAFILVYRRCFSKELHPKKCRKEVVLMKVSPIYAEPRKGQNSKVATAPLLPPVVHIKHKKWNRVKSDMVSMSEYYIPLDKSWEVKRSNLVLGNQLGK